MRTRSRRCVAALATVVLLAGLAHPAVAVERMYDEGGQSSSVPMLLDVLVMRPMGLALTLTGTALYVFPVAPLMAVVRPSDLGKPLGPLVVTPGRFTFADPIGQHPVR